MEDKDLKTLTLEDYDESKKRSKKSNNKKSGFKKEYIPIIGLILLLLVLIVILILVFNYEKNDFDINIEEEDIKVVDKVVDTSDSKCEQKEINILYNKANELSINYKPVKKVVGHGIDMETGEKVDTYGYVQKVDIRNLNDDLYLIVNSTNKTSKQKNLKLTNKDAKEGVLTYFTEYTNDLVTYNIKVYSSNGDCADELFREFEFNTPISNRYSAMDICDSYPNFKYCQKYISEDRPTQEEFQIALAQYQKANKVTTAKDGAIISSNLEEHQPKDEEKEEQLLWIILVGGAIVLLLTATVATLLIVTKKKGAKK